ncbi:MAG: hypothetical protein HWN80_19155 [Candidatus Lokiarchaeota archaeon]|nr:hypothetical protein [Candidatus Lokiarchaeota archaeon]
MWYTLDDGLHNITISSFVGVIHQLEWSSLLEGHVTIKFFANDTVGNVGYEEVIFIKEINLEPAIPGFNITTIFFLFIVISLIIVYLRKKKVIEKR